MTTEQIYKTIENIIYHCQKTYDCEECQFHIAKEVREMNGLKTRCSLAEILSVLKKANGVALIDLEELKKVMSI